MLTPNVATITASLVRSLQNCSLNHQHSRSPATEDGDSGRAVHGSDSPLNLSATTTLELNSQASIPFHWEQCLDLKTGELYYINWRTGMKAKEVPRTAEFNNGDYYSDDDSTSFDSDGSRSESFPSSSEEQRSGTNNNQENSYYQEKDETENNINSNSNDNNSINNINVLVVAGCKCCLMYYMVPKQLEICPKCCGQLLHFDRSENGSS